MFSETKESFALLKAIKNEFEEYKIEKKYNFNSSFDDGLFVPE